jgi:hypothetical protein
MFGWVEQERVAAQRLARSSKALFFFIFTLEPRVE